MLKKLAMLIFSYTLMLLSFLGFFTYVGYMILMVDWYVSGLQIAIKALLSLIIISICIAAYGIAEKLRIRFSLRTKF
ncbi:hypothetical protein D3M71_20055 [Erwinia billingiae]|nr:hypothetical protein [Erwinia billingiae]